MSDLEFEWNGAKNRSNLKKHGISFDEAKTVFSDELGRLMPDPDHSIDEERFILLGTSTYIRLLVVCHCEKRHGQITDYFSKKSKRSRT